MFDRLNRWLTFNVLFALFPFAISVGLRLLHGRAARSWVVSSPEILIFDLMVCASALGDMGELRAKNGLGRPLRVANSVLLLGAALSGVLYGALLQDTLDSPGSADFHDALFRASVVLAVTFFAVATAAQVLMGYAEQIRNVTIDS